MKHSLIATLVLSLALCTGALASQGNGSGQDNSPGNGINNSGTPNNPNHPNNGNHNAHGDSSGGPSTGGNGGSGGQGGQGGSASGGDSNAIAGASATSVAGASSNSNQKQGQGQTQGQGQGQSQSANNNGNAQSTTFNQNQVRQAPTAYSPDAFPSAPCRVSGSAGVSAPIGGISLGGSKLDKDCSRRETARSFMNLGLPEAACKILLSTRDAKEAKLTPEDCTVPVKPVTLVVPEVQAPVNPTQAQR